MGDFPWEEAKSVIDERGLTEDDLRALRPVLMSQVLWPGVLAYVAMRDRERELTEPPNPRT